MAWIGPAIAAGSSILSFLGQQNANEANIQLGREQMDFQERMSSTAYQRAMADMQTAGLNPMLAYSQGGASSPVGSMPQVQNAAGGVASSAAQGMQVMQGMQSIVQSEAQSKLLTDQATKLRSETFDQNINNAYRLQELRNLQAEHPRIEQSTTTDENRSALYAAQAEGERATAEDKLRQLTARKKYGYHSADAAIREEQRRGTKAEASISELGIAEAAGSSKFYEKAEDMPKIIKLLLDMIRGGGSARRSFGGH